MQENKFFFNNGLFLSIIFVTLLMLLILLDFVWVKKGDDTITIDITYNNENDQQDTNLDEDNVFTGKFAELLVQLKVLYSKKSYLKALAIQKKLVQLLPNAPDAYFYGGLLGSKLDDTPGAIKNYQHALKLQPNHQRASFNLGLILLDAGDYGAACERLKFSADTSGNRIKAKALSALGSCYLKQKKYLEAVAVLKKSLEFRPSHAGTWRKLASAHQQLPGNESQAHAMEALQKAIALRPGYTAAYLDLALLKEKLGQFDETKQLLRKATSKNPDHQETRLRLAEFYYNTQSKNNALKHYKYLTRHSNEEAISRYAQAMALLINEEVDLAWNIFNLLNTNQFAGKTINLPLRKGEALLLKGEREKALVWYQQAKQDPALTASQLAALTEGLLSLGKSANALELLQRFNVNDSYHLLLQVGKIYQKLANDDQAIAYYQRCLALNPKSRTAQFQLARIFSAQGKADLALQQYDMLIAHEPEYVPALYNRALMQERLKLTKQAGSSYQVILQIDPEHRKSKINLAEIYLQQKNYNDAKPLIADATLQAPNDYKARYIMAAVLTATKNYKGAKEELHRIYLLQPDYLPALKLKGKIALLQDEVDLAAKTYLRVLELDIDYYSGLMLSAKKALERNKTDVAVNIYRALLETENKANQAKVIKGILARCEAEVCIKAMLTLLNARHGDKDEQLLVIQLLQHDKQYQQALEKTAQLLVEDENNVQLIKLAARLNEETGDWNQALAHYNRLYKLNPSDMTGEKIAALELKTRSIQ